MIDLNYDLGLYQSNTTEEMISNIKKVIDITMESEGFYGVYEVSLSFVDDNEIQSLNLEYRGKNSPTDVLSFPMFEKDELESIKNLETKIPELIGDIIISFPTAKEQASEYNHSINREICFLVCHSMLHLLGYDHMDQEEKEIMEEKQRWIMDKSGISRDK